MLGSRTELAISVAAISLFAAFPGSIRAEEPPIELPPITVIGPDYPTGIISICYSAACESALGSEIWEGLLESQQDTIGDEDFGGFVFVPIDDIDDNPNNNVAANCNSEGEIREAHAAADIGPELTNVDVGDFVRIHIMAVVKLKYS